MIHKQTKRICYFQNCQLKVTLAMRLRNHRHQVKEANKTNDTSRRTGRIRNVIESSVVSLLSRNLSDFIGQQTLDLIDRTLKNSLDT